MVYGMTLITHASSVFPLFSYVARFFIHQTAAGMTSSSRVFLSSEKVDKVLDEILSDSESSFLDSDSSGIDDLPVGEAIAVERTEDEDSDSESAVQSVSTADRFTWEDMPNYVGRREQFIRNCGPQNDAKDVTEGADIFKLFFTQDLVEMIVRKTNIYAEQCIVSRGPTIPLRSRMRDWKPNWTTTKIREELT
jgi:hypothetical protein